MRAIAAREAENRFSQLLDDAQHAPVLITRCGRGITVMLSVEQYVRLRGVAWDRLSSAMDAMAKEAEANGLTDAKLAELLVHGS